MLSSMIKDFILLPLKKLENLRFLQLKYDWALVSEILLRDLTSKDNWDFLKEICNVTPFSVSILHLNNVLKTWIKWSLGTSFEENVLNKGKLSWKHYNWIWTRRIQDRFSTQVWPCTRVAFIITYILNWCNTIWNFFIHANQYLSVIPTCDVR